MRPSTKKRQAAGTPEPIPEPQRNAATDGLGDDLLVNIKTIARFLGQPQRRVQHWADTGAIPVFQTGGLWTALKSELRRHFTDRKSNAA